MKFFRLLLAVSIAALVASTHLAGQSWSGTTSSSFSTATNWSGGTLPANDGTAVVTLGSASSYTVSLDSSWSVYSLSFESAATSGYNFSGSGSPTLTVGAGGISDSTGRSLNSNGGFTIALPQDISYYVSGGTDFANWTFSGTGGITKTGAGKLTMSSGLVNNLGWSGTLTVNAGTLAFNNDNKLGAVPSSATAGMINLNGGTFNPTSTLTINANRGIAVTSGSTITISSLATVTYGGVMTGSSALSLTGGTLTLSGANTYSGTLTLGSGGTLKLSSATTLQNATIAATSGTLSFGVTATTIGGLSGSRAITLSSSGTGVALSVGANNSSTTYSGILSSTGRLVKVGTGALTLTGASTYSGGTTIDAGTLFASNSTGSATGTGTVTVNTGATLGGTGTISGLTTIASGGTLAPGSSPGTLTFTGGLTLNDGAALNFELGTTSDLIRVSAGTLTGSASAGGITLNLANAGGFAADTYVLFNFSGATTSSFDLSDFTLGTTISGYDYALAFNGNALELTATVSAVPEPRTYAAALAAAALLATALSRRPRFSPPLRN